MIYLFIFQLIHLMKSIEGQCTITEDQCMHGSKLQIAECKCDCLAAYEGKQI